MWKTLPSYLLLASVSLLFVFGLLTGYDLYQSYQDEATYTRLYANLADYRNRSVLIIGLVGSGLLIFKYWTYAPKRVTLLVYLALLVATMIVVLMGPERQPI
ncbi:hypothetical protein [Siphonobacter curvatus]|uniref:Uncharacterized protein n=1 Tax=Siphonobacter curvatus TaxID=2094562 RepID=A0A2S7IEM6_9BACT|nr:hypothetical protein [Siphonobacter curvatus]PQA52859.1 hypothetical protein C5O19_25615 [Siphonobacter curvatus]